MYLLDTNVISELRKARSGKADANVIQWAQSLSAKTMFLSAITVLELEVGVRQVERRDQHQGLLLRQWLEERVLATFKEQILSFDLAVSRACAAMHVPDARPDRDAMIAATALVHGLTVATRNVRDFAPLGVGVVDPWAAK